MEERKFLDAVKEHRGLIIKISKMYFENKEDQEDLFQEVLLQSWKSIHSFKKESQFSTWLYKVAINTAIVFFKKSKKNEKTPEALEIMDVKNSKDERLDLFYSAVRQLNKIEKALMIQYIDGLSGDEIAKNMGLTPANVRVKITRTKQKLKSLIKIENNEF